MELRQRRKPMEAAPPGKGEDTEDLSKGKKGEFEVKEYEGWNGVGFITAFVVILLVRSLSPCVRSNESLRVGWALVFFILFFFCSVLCLSVFLRFRLTAFA